MQHSSNQSPSMTGPTAGPGIDILHKVGNRALSSSKKSLADASTLQTFDRAEPLPPLCDASTIGSTVQCQHEQDIVDPPSIIKLFQEHPSDIPRWTPSRRYACKRRSHSSSDRVCTW